MTAPVAFIAHEMGSVGGIQTYVRDFLLAQGERHDIRTLSRDRSPLGLPHMQCTSTSQALSLLRMGAQARLMRPRAVIADQVQTAAAARLASFASNRRTATFAYGAELTGGRKGHLKQATLASVDQVWAITEWARQFLIEDYRLEPDRVAVLLPSVDLARYVVPSPAQRVADREFLARCWGVDKGHRVVLTVARLHPEARHKGVDLAIRAMADLRDAGRRATHVVVGDGPDRGPLEELARRTRSSTVFTGSTPDADLTRLFRAADVFCMPSHNTPFGDGYRTEGFGIVYLQAAASGVPSVRGTAAGTAEAVLAGVTGSMASADSRSVAEQIDHWLARGSQGRDGVARDCRAWSERFSGTHFSARARQYFDHLVGPSR